MNVSFMYIIRLYSINKGKVTKGRRYKKGGLHEVAASLKLIPFNYTYKQKQKQLNYYRTEQNYLFKITGIIYITRTH